MLCMRMGGTMVACRTGGWHLHGMHTQSCLERRCAQLLCHFNAWLWQHMGAAFAQVGFRCGRSYLCSYLMVSFCVPCSRILMVLYRTALLSSIQATGLSSREAAGMQSQRLRALLAQSEACLTHVLCEQPALSSA